MVHILNNNDGFITVTPKPNAAEAKGAGYNLCPDCHWVEPKLSDLITTALCSECRPMSVVTEPWGIEPDCERDCTPDNCVHG